MLVMKKGKEITRRLFGFFYYIIQAAWMIIGTQIVYSMRNNSVSSSYDREQIDIFCERDTFLASFWSILIFLIYYLLFDYIANKKKLHLY